MFKGSLYGKWEGIVTFTVMIVLADQEGEVDMTAEALAAATSIPLDIIQKGIALLESPDPQSRTPDEDGRRIVRVSDARDWGWRITNYAHYRAIRTAEERREYFKQHKRKQRAAKKDKGQRPPLSTNGPQSPPIAVSSKQYVEGEAEGFNDWWAKYPKRSGSNSRVLALKAYRARRTDGVPASDLLAGLERYAAYIQATGKAGTEYVKQAASFLGPAEHWKESWEWSTVPVQATRQDRNLAAIQEGLRRHAETTGDTNGNA